MNNVVCVCVMQMWLVVVCCRSCRRLPLLLLLLRCLRRMTAEPKSKYCYLGGSEVSCERVLKLTKFRTMFLAEVSWWPGGK